MTLFICILNIFSVRATSSQQKDTKDTFEVARAQKKTNYDKLRFIVLKTCDGMESVDKK